MFYHLTSMSYQFQSSLLWSVLWNWTYPVLETLLHHDFLTIGDLRAEKLWKAVKT
jgi:hypothetical protein